MIFCVWYQCIKMAMLRTILLFCLVMTFSVSSLAAVKQVALTIDDLPFVGHASDAGKLRRQNARFKKILEVLRLQSVPAAGFVVSASIAKGQWSLLEQFKQAGNIIANHTDRHIHIDRQSLFNYLRDIDRADQRLRPLISVPKYFRYPFLAMGNNCKRYLAVRRHLDKLGYQIAPVTMDSKDYKLNHKFHAVYWRNRLQRLDYFRDVYLQKIRKMINAAEKTDMKQRGRLVKQIFLIHMNTLNAYFLKDVIQLFRKQGYHFITLKEAMADPYNQSASIRCQL